MTAHKQPRTLAAATTLLERFAEVDGAMADIELMRNAEISAANVAADEKLAPLIGEAAQLRTLLFRWWAVAGPGLTQGKRKSMTIGGCDIGTRAGRVTLDVAGDARALAKDMVGKVWAKPLVTVTYGLDRATVLKALDGKDRAKLAKLGFAKVPASEAFFVNRAVQPGTVAGS